MSLHLIPRALRPLGSSEFGVMKKSIHKISHDILKNDFPIKGKIPGWYFRQKEVSNGAWEVGGARL